MDDTGLPPPEPREDRGPRIPPAKLATIKPEPTISIFHKTNRNAALNLLDGKFSRDAAMIFCDRIRHDLMDKNTSKAFTVVGGDLTGLKEVLAWIKQCVREGSIVKLKDLDEATPNLLTRYTNVIVSATQLGIPPRDLSDHILKRMLAISRKVLMTWDEVEWFYKTPTLSPKNEAVREVAAASVFWAWWNFKLDENETPEDMMILSALRDKIKKLDQDLHDMCEKNEEQVRAKWEEKRKAKEGEGELGGDTSGSGGGTGGGWDQAVTSFPASGESNWDTAGDELAKQNGSNAFTDTGFDSGIDVKTGKTTPSFGPEDHGAGGYHPIPGAFDLDDEGSGDWADEVNQHDQYQNQKW